MTDAGSLHGGSRCRKWWPSSPQHRSLSPTRGWSLPMQHGSYRWRFILSGRPCSPIGDRTTHPRSHILCFIGPQGHGLFSCCWASFGTTTGCAYRQRCSRVSGRRATLKSRYRRSGYPLRRHYRENHRCHLTKQRWLHCHHQLHWRSRPRTLVGRSCSRLRYVRHRCRATEYAGWHRPHPLRYGTYTGLTTFSCYVQYCYSTSLHRHLRDGPWRFCPAPEHDKLAESPTPVLQDLPCRDPLFCRPRNFAVHLRHPIPKVK